MIEFKLPSCYLHSICAISFFVVVVVVPLLFLFCTSETTGCILCIYFIFIIGLLLYKLVYYFALFCLKLLQGLQYTSLTFQFAFNNMKRKLQRYIFYFPSPTLYYFVVIYFTFTYIINAPTHYYQFSLSNHLFKKSFKRSILYLPTYLSFLAFLLPLSRSRFPCNIISLLSEGFHLTVLDCQLLIHSAFVRFNFISELHFCWVQNSDSFIYLFIFKQSSTVFSSLHCFQESLLLLLSLFLYTQCVFSSLGDFNVFSITNIKQCDYNVLGIVFFLFLVYKSSPSFLSLWIYNF